MCNGDAALPPGNSLLLADAATIGKRSLKGLDSPSRMVRSEDVMSPGERLN